MSLELAPAIPERVNEDQGAKEVFIWMFLPLGP